MRKYAGCLMLLFFFLSLHAGAYNIDSLKRALQTAPAGRQHAILLDEVCYRYENLNTDSLLYYAHKSLDYTAEIKQDTLYIEAANYLGDALSTKFRNEEAITYYQLGLKKATDIGFKKKRVLCMQKIAIRYQKMDRYDASIDMLKQALPVAVETGNKKNEGFIYEFLADAYAHKEDYESALNYSVMSLKIRDSMKDIGNSSLNYYHIANFYSKQHRYKEALKYALVADSLLGYLKYQEDRKSNAMLMGIIYKNTGQYDRAISIYKSLLKQDNSPTLQMVLLSNLGVAQSMKGNFAEARKSFLNAVALNNHIVHSNSYAVSIYTDGARSYFRNKELDSALYYVKLAEACARKEKNYLALSEYKDCLLLLSDIYAQKQDSANAYLYNKQYVRAQDSANTLQRSKSIAEAETKFNVAEKDKALAVLAAENELQKVKTQKQTIISVALVAGMLLVGGIISVVIIAYRRTLRKNELLQQQKNELSEQKRELQEQKEIIDDQVIQLATAAEMKSKFLGNVSHELRTPVTLLTGMLGLMRDDNETVAAAKRKERLTVAYNNSRKLQQMVEEILDITRLEKSDAKLKTEVKEALPLIRRMVYAFETLIEKERIKLTYEEGGRTGIYIKTDENKLEKIINNLVYNAIKFTGSGGNIHVSVSTSANDKDLLLSISDTGIGISEKDLPHIFERYYQGDANGNPQGVGIGLSLVKEFTELLGGTVSVSSRQGLGTTFQLQFPTVEFVAPEPPEAEPELPMPVENWAVFPQKQKVLLVEDNTEMRYYLNEILSPKVTVAEANNGVAALEWLRNNTPDLIITDIMMPEMDGKEFVSHLKESDTYKKIPVVTLTALADMDYQLNMLRMGVDDYIVKPFNADELRIRIYNILSNQLSRIEFIKNEPQEPNDLPVHTAEADAFRAKITEYVLARLNNFDVSVDDMAVELGVSRPQLYRFAKSLTGCTPAQLIREVKLMKAYELLLNGEVQKIEDLARRVGYEHQGYFSRQFLERFGKRPSDFL